jgi:hypothetical protein
VKREKVRYGQAPRNSLPAGRRRRLPVAMLELVLRLRGNDGGTMGPPQLREQRLRLWILRLPVRT